MTKMLTRKDWQLPESQATPEHLFRTRRQWLKGLAWGTAMVGGAALLPQSGLAKSGELEKTLRRNEKLKISPGKSYPLVRGDRVTSELDFAQYNNFYEFSTQKYNVWPMAQKLVVHPWQVKIGGLVKRSRVLDMEYLLKNMALEERIYRFRCVEAWSMVVPWVGFPFSSLLSLVEPLSSAKYVEFESFYDPETAQGQEESLLSNQPWPYGEGLRIDEAFNELTLLTVGSYGHRLPKQNGAPLRLVLPWKYGYKSIKSIVKINFVRERPPTFWNTLAPSEYGFYSNVDPTTPHPRWSQAYERVVGGNERQKTLPYNGYASFVQGLYPA